MKSYPIWLADLEGEPNYPCLMHQYSWEVKMNGSPETVDGDYYFGELKSKVTETKESITPADKIEKATVWMEDLANDNSHGYDQIYRWGEKGDYDCSSAVITAWENSGVPVKSKGGATYTGNMRSAFLNYGFKNVTSSINLSTGDGLQRGDVLLNDVHHVAMYVGNGKEVEASINEKGGATGGQPGDQTGQEIKIRSYRNYPWNIILRYGSTDESINLLQKGSKGNDVKDLQIKLNKLGAKLDVDGDFGELTRKAVIEFQTKQKLETDGIVGPITLAKINSEIEKLSQQENLTPINFNPILNFKNGQIIEFIGNKHYTSSYSSGKEKKCNPGEAVIDKINTAKNAVHPYHLKPTNNSKSTVNGWVNENDIQEKSIETIAPTPVIVINTKMKYNDKNKPLECMMTNSTCYLQTRKMSPKGILWHSTGANNPYLKRYVQPSKTDKNYQELISKLGLNNYGNDWNHITTQTGVNAWIGKLADNTITTVQTMPWDYRPWGCGSGANGSCNDFWIQFEICEDNLINEQYFNEVYNEAIELTAYLCKLYNLNPKGTVKYNTIDIPVILCHADSYKYGTGSNHGDVYHWFNKYNKTMDDVRNDVAKVLSVNTESNIHPIDTIEVDPSYATITVGDIIIIDSNATYTSGQAIPQWVFKSTLYAREIRKNEIVFSTQPTGAITGVVSKTYVSKKATAEAVFEPYFVVITANALNVRSGPGSNYNINTIIKKDEVYTIIEEKDGWGKLKSGSGWINLQYTKKR